MPHDDMREALDRAADDGWPDDGTRNGVTRLKVAP
jgi:hypothetical protein